MQPKVSIIVPVYNAGDAFKTCIESLLNQTLQEIQIVLVLDCPTDGTDKIACEYAKNDNRIHIVRNEQNINIGLSRNRGLQEADGEYIGFADHDDYCNPDMFESLYLKAVANDADIVVSDYICRINGTDLTYGFPLNIPNDSFNQLYFKALVEAQYSKGNTRSFVNVNPIWNQIYKKDLIEQNSVKFPDNRIISMEDVMFSLQIHYYAKNVVYEPHAFYTHIVDGRNAYMSYDYLSFAKTNNFLQAEISFLKKVGIYEQYMSELSICCLRKLYTSFLNELRFKNIRKAIKSIKQIRHDEDYQVLLGNLATTGKAGEHIKGLTIPKKIYLHILGK